MLIDDEMTEEKWRIFNQALDDVDWYRRKFPKVEMPCEMEIERAKRARKLLPEFGLIPKQTEARP